MDNTLFAHQELGAEWLAATQFGGLFDEQGLGKTITAIVAAERAGARSILVLTPTVVVHNWEREFSKWAPRRVVQVISTGSGRIRTDDAQVVVTTHGLLLAPALRKQILDREWDLCVLDEAQFFKNPRAQRTRVFYAGVKRKNHVDARSVVTQSRRVWLLTGTPMPNNPSELWAHLRGLASERIWAPGTRVPMTFSQFRERFCVLAPSPFDPQGKVVGTKNVVELKQRMRGFSLRRLKRDHLDLPPMRWGTVALTIGELPEQLKAAERALPRSGNPDLHLDVIAALKDSEEFSTWRRLCGLAKAPAAAEMLSDELEGTQHKLVLFCHHTEVVDLLCSKLAAHGVVEITGRVSAENRQRAVDKFQRQPQTRVAVCNIVAGGLGITLTAAQDVVFVESSFVPGDNAQAADRVHRIGQSGSVLVRVLTLAGSVDEVVGEVLARKSEMIKQVLS